MALVGARGGSEFIARSGLFNSSDSSLLDTTTGKSLAQSKTFSLAIVLRQTVTDNRTIFHIANSGSIRVSLGCDSSGNLTIYGLNSTPSYIVNLVTELETPIDEFSAVLISVDTQDISKCKVYINGVNSSFTSSSITDDFIDLLPSSTIAVGSNSSQEQNYGGDIGFTYFTTDYIDFSEESNRNLFVNQLGMPRQIEPMFGNEIPMPLIYLPFDDPDNLGKNLGSGSDMVVNGDVQCGADFSLN